MNINEFLYLIKVEPESWNNIVHRIGEKRAKLCLEHGLIHAVSLNTVKEKKYGLTDLGKEMLENSTADGFIEKLESREN